MIQAAARGEPALTAPLAAKILAEFARIARATQRATDPRNHPDTEHEDPNITSGEILTAREQEVLQSLVDGLSNREISIRLFVSENTVKYHLRNILGKLHLQNRAQVVAYALRGGLARTEAPGKEDLTR
jgi:DNA-binding NarL/FixJ family response regulator